MSRKIHELRAELEQIRRVLKEGTLLAHDPELNRALGLGVHEILLKADSEVSGTLLVGLIGGTGVGKSSLTNALAGHPVASSSHRRPHTDRVLLYRHVSCLLPAAVRDRGDLLQEITHNAEGIAQVVLCDLPDFDSMVASHRRTVLDFMAHLDLLVWVVTPEKYADGSFYKLLQEVPKAGGNFVFVLNKADLLFESVTASEGYDRLARANDLFAQHLMNHGIMSPVVFCISAEQVVEGKPAAPWNQFPLFRDLLFQRRENKEIAAIKAANLDVETRVLLRQLEAEILRIKSLVEVLDHYVREVEQGRSDWAQAGQKAIRRWVLGLPLEQLAGHRSDPGQALAGPALLMAVLARRPGRSGGDGGHAGAELVGCTGSNSPLAGLQRELERFGDRLTQRMLQVGLPQALIDDVRHGLDLEDRWIRLTQSLEETTDALVSAKFVPSRRGFLFVQRIVHGCVYGLFVASLARSELLSAMVQSPSVSNLLTLCVDLLLGLFRATGVAALGSLIILQLFLGLRFFLRHKKWLQHRTQRFIESLEQALVRVWESEMDELLSACQRVVADRAAAVEKIEGLRGAGREN
ncbi:MAG: GTPase [Syntrophobacteraceae bacterium]